jgi:hypothetical protein
LGGGRGVKEEDVILIKVNRGSKGFGESVEDAK